MDGLYRHHKKQLTQQTNLQPFVVSLKSIRQVTKKIPKVAILVRDRKRGIRKRNPIGFKTNSNIDPATVESFRYLVDNNLTPWRLQFEARKLQVLHMR